MNLKDWEGPIGKKRKAKERRRSAMAYVQHLLDKKKIPRRWITCSRCEESFYTQDDKCPKCRRRVRLDT